MRKVIRAASAALLLLVIVATPASAHAELVDAAPGPDSVVTEPPAELVANFSQDLDPARTSLEVRDAAGNRVARGGELGANDRQFRLELPVLEPGAYEVRWTTFSAEDDELARGSYEFTVEQAPTPEPTPVPTPSPTPTPTRAPTPAPTAAPTASPVPSSTPLSTPSPSPSPTPTPPPTASPTATPDAPTASPNASPIEPSPASDATDISVLLPILAALAVVGGFVLWRSRRAAP